MNKRFTTILTAALTAFLPMVSSAQGDEFISIGTGGITGVYYRPAGRFVAWLTRDEKSTGFAARRNPRAVRSITSTLFARANWISALHNPTGSFMPITAPASLPSEALLRSCAPFFQCIPNLLLWWREKIPAFVLLTT